MKEQLSSSPLYGQSLKTCEVAAFALSERVYPPNFKTPKHSHNRALFCFVVQGGYTETYGRRTCACEPSTLLFHAPGDMHSEHFHNSGGRSFIIEIDSVWLDDVQDQLGKAESSADFNGGILSLFGKKLYKEFLAWDQVSPLVIEGLMMAMFGETARRASHNKSAQPPRWLGQAKDILHTRFADPLTLADIAGYVGVHPVHLAQVFHKHYHCTVGGYIRQLRIEFACRELAGSDTPLTQIALAAGFADHSHFTRTFKRRMGIPPSQYREIFRAP